MPAAAMRLAASASTSAGSSTTFPRATLTSTADRFIAAKALAPISRSVSGVSGQVSATASACGSSSAKRSCENTASAASVPLDGSRLVAIVRMPKARARAASRAPMRPSPTISSVLPPSSSSRCVRSEIMPRQKRLVWLSRARCSCRVSARISAMACCATASAFTPCALASRMPAAARASRAYWSVPALIDWMKASRGARAMNSLRHSIETESTSNSPSRAVSSSRLATWKCLMLVPRSAKRSAIRYATWAKQIVRFSFEGRGRICQSFFVHVPRASTSPGPAGGVGPTPSPHYCTRCLPRSPPDLPACLVVPCPCWLQLALCRCSPSVARLSSTIDGALDQSRGLRRFDELADMGEPFGPAFRNHQRGEIGAIAVLEQPRAGQLGGIIKQGRTDGSPCVRTPAPQQVECSVRSFGDDLFGLLCDAAESQRRGVIAYDRDPNPGPIHVGDAAHCGARRHEKGIFHLHERGREATDLVSPGRVETQRADVAAPGVEAFDELAGSRQLRQGNR